MVEIDSEDIKFLGTLQIVPVKSGDTIILMTEQIMSNGRKEKLQAYWQNKFTKNQVVFIPDGVKLGVLSANGKY